MKILRILAIIIILAVILPAVAACQKIASPLEDFNWILTRYGDPGSMKTPLPDTQVTAFFDSKEKKVSGSGGCNTYGGAYTVDHLSLTITGPLVMTEMSCGGEKDIQENQFLNALQKADSFELEQGQLIIHSGNYRLYFKQTDIPVKTISQWGE